MNQFFLIPLLGLALTSLAVRAKDTAQEHHADTSKVEKVDVSAKVTGHEKKEATAAAHHGSEGVEPTEALQWLKNGNTRFTTGFLRRDGTKKADIQRLSTGQKPHSIVLSCSDSRVPPELVFDQKLGELFVVRTAGEVIESTAIASIEYAVEHLGSRNIVVMGHTNCGAVKAAMSTFGGKDAGSANLNKLVADIHPRIKEFEKKTTSKDFQDEAWANAKGVAADLLSRSPILAEKVKSGHVKITPALYHLDAGKVDFEK